MSNKHLSGVGDGMSTPDPTPYAPNQMPSLLDREIATHDADAFGHVHFASALRSLVESERNVPPFSIGLLGKWGTGKSSIKALYIEGLNEDRQRDERGLVRSQRVRAITFNAWRFGGENIRRALLRHVFTELGGDEESITDELFNQVQKSTLVAKERKEIARELYDRWLWTLVQVLTVVAALLGATWVAKRVFGLSSDWSITAVLGIQTMASAILLKVLFDAKLIAVSRYATVNRVEMPSASAEQFESCLVDQIVKFHTKHKDCERLVVFVDDLDRLSAEEMVSGLDAIRTFMEIPQHGSRPDAIRMVFVISCDEDRVAQALHKRRHQDSGDLPGVIFTDTDARRYLDRIFQFRLEIPPFPRQDMRSFALEKIRAELPGTHRGIESHGGNVEEVVNRMIHVGVHSPRNALQIVNAFAEAWWIAEQREREGAGSDRRGGLAEGAVTGHPLALAALCALRVDFPEFYGQLLQEPDLIHRFLDVFVHQKPLAQQPEGVRLVLEKYALTPKDGGQDSTTVSKLIPAKRPLRQFLTSVSSIPWPHSVQPLLLLSQDPVSRKIGDAGQRIYDAFMSGDTPGVLADLGRGLDDRLLDKDQVRWLRDLAEQAEEDTDDRRDNAASVLAQLTNRYPEADAPQVLVPLARRLARSKPLRQRVGVEKIPPILPFLPVADQRAVTGRFAEDLLLAGEDLDFRLPSGETPSLDEAEAMVRTVVGFCLDARDRCGLDPQADQQLLDWLLVRHVGVAGKTDQLAFSELEGWLDAHSSLVTALSWQYVASLADVLADAEASKSIEISSAMLRCEQVLNLLWDAGEESRQTAWGLANRLVSVSQPEANLVGQGHLRSHEADAPASVVSDFVKNAAVRVAQHANKDYLAEADGDALTLMTQLVAAKREGKAETLSAVATLCIKLSQFEVTAQQAVNLTTELIACGPKHGQTVLMAWAERHLTNLPVVCLILLARHFIDWTDEATQQKFATQLDSVVQSVPPDANQSERYLSTITGIPGKAFASEPLLSHSRLFLSTVQQQWNNAAYLNALFPAAPIMVEFGPPAEVGQMLHALMSQATSTPQIYGFLHGIMNGHWPNADAALAPYDPVNIFTWGKSVIEANPSLTDGDTVLLSLEDLVRSGRVGNTLDAQLVAAAIVLWPYHGAAASQVLVRATSIPSPEAIATLARGVSPSDESQVRRLGQTWRHLVTELNADQVAAATKALLAEPPQTLGSLPDVFLSLWCDQIAFELPGIVTTIIGEAGLGDEAKLRAWKQTERRISSIPKPAAVALLNLAVVSTADIARSALAASVEFENHFPGTGGKYDLGVLLVSLLAQANSLDSKNTIAAWLTRLGNQTVLRRVNRQSHSEEDIQILRRQFPKSKLLPKP